MLARENTINTCGHWVIDGRSTALRVSAAVTFRHRLIGVGYRVRFEQFDVLCFPRCRAVHTFGLSKAIDVIFVSDSFHVLAVRSCVPPWRVVRHGRAASVWETRAGMARALGVQIGVRVSVYDDSGLMTSTG